jgi:alpha-glucosidase
MNKVFCFLLCCCHFHLPASADWWETAAIYQVYVRSFLDTNGDGIGDLNGLFQKLEYIKEIGMDAILLSPIYKSPMVDFGWDISDFRDVDPEYGKMVEFERVVRKAKVLDIRVLLDIVINHSSDEHEWFLKSANRTKGYEDYYIWHPGRTSENGTNPQPPSNWVT